MRGNAFSPVGTSGWRRWQLIRQQGVSRCTTARHSNTASRTPATTQRQGETAQPSPAPAQPLHVGSFTSPFSRSGARPPLAAVFSVCVAVEGAAGRCCCVGACATPCCLVVRSLNAEIVMAIMVARFTYPSKKKARSAGERQIWGVHDQNAGPANLGRLYRFAPSGSEGSCT